MWIFTEFGFFSIVAHRDKPGFVLVRARAREDIEAFRRMAGSQGQMRIQHTPTADYPYRAVTSAKLAAWVVSQELEHINYDNFKARVEESQGGEREHVYMGVWAHLRHWLRSRGSGRRDRVGLLAG